MGYHDRYPADAIEGFRGHADREAEKAMHPLAAMTIEIPRVGCPTDDRDRRQLVATYYGMMAEVDDQCVATTPDLIAILRG